jgi:hypothetical protein
MINYITKFMMRVRAIVKKRHAMLDMHDMSDRTLGIVGITLGIASVGAQVLFPDTWLLWVFCVSVGFTLFIWFLLRDFSGQYLRFRYKAVIVCLTFISLVWISVRQAYRLHELPDVEMRLVYPQIPAVLLVNPSSKVVQQPKYMIVIWNLNKPGSEVLPIPTKVGDYIRPKEGLGPNQLVSLPQVAPLLTRGDHLFGFGMALCPDCASTRYYWIYIEHGVGGWYAELPKGQIIDVNELIRKIPTIAPVRDRFLNDLVPKATRVPIRNWPNP